MSIGGYVIIGIVIFLNLLLAFCMGRVHAKRPLMAALRRAQGRMRVARWMIYSDWAKADELLGVGERDAATVLHDNVLEIRAPSEQPTYEELQMFISAHCADDDPEGVQQAQANYHH